MTSILSFIKRYGFETLFIIAIACVLLFNTVGRSNDGGEESGDIQQIRTELIEIRDSNQRILEGISEYAESARKRDADFIELREYIGTEIRGVRTTIEDARQSDLSAGDRNLEAGILIDENRRLLRELREGE